MPNNTSHFHQSEQLKEKMKEINIFGMTVFQLLTHKQESKFKNFLLKKLYLKMKKIEELYGELENLKWIDIT